MSAAWRVAGAMGIYLPSGKSDQSVRTKLSYRKNPAGGHIVEPANGGVSLRLSAHQGCLSEVAPLAGLRRKALGAVLGLKLGTRPHFAHSVMGREPFPPDQCENVGQSRPSFSFGRSCLREGPLCRHRNGCGRQSRQGLETGFGSDLLQGLQGCLGRLVQKRVQWKSSKSAHTLKLEGTVRLQENLSMLLTMRPCGNQLFAEVGELCSNKQAPWAGVAPLCFTATLSAAAHSCNRTSRAS